MSHTKLCSAPQDARLAEAVCAYLVGTFPMCEEGNIRLEPYHCPVWGKDEKAILIEKEYLTYTNTIDQIRHAARDFRAGWQAANA